MAWNPCVPHDFLMNSIKVITGNYFSCLGTIIFVFLSTDAAPILLAQINFFQKGKQREKTFDVTEFAWRALFRLAGSAN